MFAVKNTVRSSHRRFSTKKMFLKNSQDSQENTCVGASLLIKLQASGDYKLFFISNTFINNTRLKLRKN